MTKKEIISFWLQSAKDNIGTAEAMLTAKRWNFAMFMCQQAIEALLKAIYIMRIGERPPQIHNLPRLFDLIGLKAPQEIDHALLVIDAHYLKARYFADRFDSTIYNKKAAIALIKQTKEVVRWLRTNAGLKNW